MNKIDLTSCNNDYDRLFYTMVYNTCILKQNATWWVLPVPFNKSIYTKKWRRISAKNDKGNIADCNHICIKCNKRSSKQLAWIAAPIATASSGLTDLLAARPNRSVTTDWTCNLPRTVHHFNSLLKLTCVDSWVTEFHHLLLTNLCIILGHD